MCSIFAKQLELFMAVSGSALSESRCWAGSWTEAPPGPGVGVGRTVAGRLPDVPDGGQQRSRTEMVTLLHLHTMGALSNGALEITGA